VRRPPRGQSGGRPPKQEPGALKGPVSLARALSKFGVCSRAEAARRIEAGRVSVNGAVVLWPERRIDPRRDRISVDGVRATDETERLVLVLHKPVGLLTSRTDPGGRDTVYALLGGVGRWVFPVGRLDRDTSGLLVMTNDHRLGERLTSPDQHVPKTYHARVAGVPDRETLNALREGVTLGDDTLTRKARVRVLGTPRADADGASTWLEIVLTEGKNRQVRRMCAAVGHEVKDLVRVKIGALALGDLPPGRWRRLEPAEIAKLQQVIASPRRVP
jgi:23S rRNA pseudouridine2605 synthase